MVDEHKQNDCLSKKAPWPCVVVGGELQEKDNGLHKTSTDGVPSNSGGDHMDD